MKRMFKTLLLAASLSSTFMGLVSAQSGAVADVPFQFTVHGRTLPAGEYTLRQPLTDKSIFSLSDARGQTILALFGVRSNDKNDQAKLTFVCYDGKTECILSKVAPGNGDAAFGITESELEHYRSHKIGIASLVSVKLR